MKPDVLKHTLRGFMRRFIGLFAFVPLLWVPMVVIAAAPQTRPTTAPSTQSLVSPSAKAEQVVKAFLTAVRRNDVEALMALAYTPTKEDQAQVRELLPQVVKGMNKDGELKVHASAASGDLACVLFALPATDDGLLRTRPPMILIKQGETFKIIMLPCPEYSRGRDLFRAWVQRNAW